MTFSAATTPLDCLDREHELMCRLIDRCPSGPDIDPRRQVLRLLQALGEIGCTLNASDAGPARWQVASYDLCTVLATAASIARHLDIPPYEGTEWPDGTRVGGDGAYSEDHRPHHLFAEVVAAAGWVAEGILDRAKCTAPGATAAPNDVAREWLVAVPVTELVARTWCLADRLGIRELLRELISEGLAPNR